MGGPFEPREEVCLAAEQHDIGMAAWDAGRSSTRRPACRARSWSSTLDEHLEIWWRAAPLVLPQSRYAALLVSMHGTALYERRDLRLATTSSACARSSTGSASCRRGCSRPARRSADGRVAADEVVRRNQQLVWTWDSLSLGLLLGVGRSRSTVGIEVRDGTLDPWPFAARVSLRCEGRRLAGRFDDEEAMRAALSAAPWVTLELDLAR